MSTSTFVPAKVTGARPDATRLLSLRAAGLVRRASDRVGEGVERSLPVAAALRPLLPGGVLRRGATVAVSAAGPGLAPHRDAPHRDAPHRDAQLAGVDGVRGGRGMNGSGATTLLFTLLAEASTAGSWCAAVGLPGLGLVAAAEAGVALERLALIPHPGPDWVDTIGALLEGLDIVTVATPATVTPALAARVAARVRTRGAVLIAMGSWPGADLTLEVVSGAWHGLGEGVGRLRQRELEVVASGRGAAARPRRARLWLPGPANSNPPSAWGSVPARDDDAVVRRVA